MLRRFRARPGAGVGGCGAGLGFCLPRGNLIFSGTRRIRCSRINKSRAMKWMVT